MFVSVLCAKARNAPARCAPVLLALLACGGLQSAPQTQRSAVPRRLAVTGAGTALERVTSEPQPEQHPAISPDGSILLFEVRGGAAGGSTQRTLVGVDPRTRGQRTLYTSTNSSADNPSWLPDQSSYVYASNGPGEWSLVRALAAAPNAAVNVIVSGEVAPAAAWPSVSPDGKRVAFATKVRGVPTVATVGLDGSHLVLLGEGASPAWSPDGARVAFSRRVGDANQLFTVNPNTGAELVQVTSGGYEHDHASWSPDGKYLVFSTDRGAPRGQSRATNLYIIAITGTGLTQLTDGDVLTVTPCWGRDGWIYFASDQSGSFDIWRLRPAGPLADLTPVALAGGATPVPSAKNHAQPSPSSTGPASGPPEERPACAKDTDCKGDRICERGACVSPTPPVK